MVHAYPVNAMPRIFKAYEGLKGIAITLGVVFEIVGSSIVSLTDKLFGTKDGK